MEEERFSLPQLEIRNRSEVNVCSVDITRSTAQKATDEDEEESEDRTEDSY